MFEHLPDRVKVFLTAAPTYLVALTAALTVLADQLPNAPQWIATVVVWITTAVLIIRRVTPVPVEDRGLLPTDAAGEPYDPEAPGE